MLDYPRKIRSKCYKKRIMSCVYCCCRKNSKCKKTAVYEWFRQFRDDQESVVDDDRSGRPSTTRTDEIVSRFSALLKEDRRITCQYILQRCFGTTFEAPSRKIQRSRFYSSCKTMHPHHQ